MNKFSAAVFAFMISLSAFAADQATAKKRTVQIQFIGSNGKHVGVYHLSNTDVQTVTETPPEVSCFLFGPNPDEMQISCQDKQLQNEHTIGTVVFCNKKSGPALLIFHSTKMEQTVLTIVCKPE